MRLIQLTGPNGRRAGMVARWALHRVLPEQAGNLPGSSDGRGGAETEFALFSVRADLLAPGWGGAPEKASSK